VQQECHASPGGRYKLQFSHIGEKLRDRLRSCRGSFEFNYHDIAGIVLRRDVAEANFSPIVNGYESRLKSLKATPKSTLEVTFERKCPALKFVSSGLVVD